MEISLEPRVSLKPLNRNKCKTAQAPAGFNLAFVKKSGKDTQERPMEISLVSEKILNQFVRFNRGYSRIHPKRTNLAKINHDILCERRKMTP